MLMELILGAVWSLGGGLYSAGRSYPLACGSDQSGRPGLMTEPGITYISVSSWWVSHLLGDLS